MLQGIDDLPDLSNGAQSDDDSPQHDDDSDLQQLQVRRACAGAFVRCFGRGVCPTWPALVLAIGMQIIL